jgi:hypothetical protein
MNDTAGVTQVLAAANDAPPQPARAGPSFYSLFSNDDRRAAVSPTIAQLWTSPSAAQSDSAAAAPASEPTPLDLFQDLPPNGRALFGGNA